MPSNTRKNAPAPEAPRRWRAHEVRLARKKLRWTQAELALALGLENPETSGRVSVNRWENARGPIPVWLGFGLAMFLQRAKDNSRLHRVSKEEG